MNPSHYPFMQNWKDRLFASAMHLGLSLAIAALIAWVVFGFWYPYPYREASGGRELFVLLMTVDVVMGPLITLVIFNRAKPLRERVTDLTIVGLLQLAALGYGLWTVYTVRPVFLVFEYHRLAVVHATDIDPGALSQAPPALQALPLTGPTLLSLRAFKDADEQFNSIAASLGGPSQAAQPMLWQPWEAGRADILQAAHPVAELLQRFGAHSALINSAIATTGRPADALRYLPLITRKGEWTVLLDAQTTLPMGFVPLGSF